MKVVPIRKTSNTASFLKYIRETKQMSLEAVAEKARLDAGLLNRLEIGTADVDRNTLGRIVCALGFVFWSEFNHEYEKYLRKVAA